MILPRGPVNRTQVGAITGSPLGLRRPANTAPQGAGWPASDGPEQTADNGGPVERPGKTMNILIRIDKCDGSRQLVGQSEADRCLRKATGDESLVQQLRNTGRAENLFAIYAFMPESDYQVAD